MYSNQGGSVVKNVLENAELSKTYKIRAITRDVTKPAALALKANGAEVVAVSSNVHSNPLKRHSFITGRYERQRFDHCCDPRF